MSRITTATVFEARATGTPTFAPRLLRATMSAVVDMYFEYSEDDRYSVPLTTISDWYEERGWVWVEVWVEK